MLFGIGLKVVPELVREIVFGIYPCLAAEVLRVVAFFSFVCAVEDTSKVGAVFDCWETEAIEVEIFVSSKTDHVDSFAMLRHETFRIYDSVENGVAELIPQGAKDHLECAALIVGSQVLDVLQ